LIHQDGQVFNRLANVMAVRIDRYGYANVRLNANGRQTWKKVNRLVCEAWHGPPPTPQHHAAHLDGDQLNNTPGNVAWKTPKENAADKRSHGSRMNNGGMSGETHPAARLTPDEVAAIRSSTLPSRALAAEYGVSQPHIVRIKNGQKWTKGIAQTPSQDTTHD
jgi:hypothetical protein